MMLAKINSSKWLAAVALCTISLSALGQGGIGISADGITFADGSVQSKAASAGTEAVLTVCELKSLAVDSSGFPVCTRQDSNHVISSVPSGYTLIFTDILIVPSDGSTTGNYRAAFTELNDFEDALTLVGTATGPGKTEFLAPMLVYEAGDLPEARNDATSDFPVDVHLSGFLVTSVIHHR